MRRASTLRDGAEPTWTLQAHPPLGGQRSVTEDGRVWVDRAVNAAVTAASHCGLDATGARPLRVGENVAVLLPASGVLAKVVADATLVDEVRRELSVSSWLAAQDVPVVRPVVDVPLLADDCVVSLWEYLADARPSDLVTLASCLRQLHVPRDQESSSSAAECRTAHRGRTARVASLASRR